MKRGQENHRVGLLLRWGRLFAPVLFDHQLVKLRGGTQRGKLLILHQLLSVTEAGFQRLAQIAERFLHFARVA